MDIRRITKSAMVAALTITAAFAAIGPAAASTNGTTEGCTPGYWKTHTTNWNDASDPGEMVTYAPNQTVGTYFNVSEPFASMTLLQALDGSGGKGISGATTVLLRAAVAAMLNAAYELDYPYQRFGSDGLIAQVNAAIASGDRDTILALASRLDIANNLGCPLN